MCNLINTHTHTHTHTNTCYLLTLIETVQLIRKKNINCYILETVQLIPIKKINSWCVLETVCMIPELLF